VEKYSVTPVKAGVQCSWVNKINIFWTPAFAGVTYNLQARNHTANNPMKSCTGVASSRA
jgi:hypothetical protein